MDPEALETLIAERVAAALAIHATNQINNSGRSSGPEGSESRNGDRNSTRACTYKDFMNCKPRSFNGNEGVVGLTRWVEKVESVFHISNCSIDCRVKFATCTFVDTALTWWNSQTNTMGIDIAYVIPWAELKQMLTEEYCPRSEIQNMEQEFWNLTMNGADIAAYTTRFNDLSVLCPGLVTPEYKKIERYIWGLAPQIQPHVTASRPTTYDSAKRLAHHLTAQAVRNKTLSQRDDATRTRDKRKLDDDAEEDERQSSRERQDTRKSYALTDTTQKQYLGNLPKCNQCNFHHQGKCNGSFCHRCNMKGHSDSTCRYQTTTTTPGATTG